MKWSRDIYDFIRIVKNINTNRGTDLIDLNEKYVEDVGTIINWYKTNKEKVSIRTFYNSCTFFSEDLSLLTEIEKKLTDYDFTYSEATVVGKSDVIYLQKPKHDYRVYFREKNVSEDFRKELKEFLNRYENTLFPCPTLRKWINMIVDTASYNSAYGYWRYKWLQSHFFIEYDSESALTILKLVFDKHLGKTYKLEKR